MEPALFPGDVVISRPVPASQLRAHQVILFQDPDHPGRLRLHRIVEIDGSTIITKGDGNPQQDSSHTHPDDVVGLASLRIPWIGIPVMFAIDHNWLGAGLIASGVMALTIVALCPAVKTPVVGVRQPSAVAAGLHRPDRRRRGLTTLGAVVALTLAGVGMHPSPAEASPFSSSTRSWGYLQAATAQAPSGLWCQGNGNGGVTVGWNYNGDRPAGFDVLADGYGTVQQLGSDARSTTINTNSGLPAGPTWTIRVRTNLTNTWTATSSSTVKVRIVSFFWVGIFTQCV